MAKQPGGGEPPLQFSDRETLEAWLNTQEREAAVAIAARAALRVAPLAWRVPQAGDRGGARRFLNLTSAIFRATAVARVAGAYPTRANELRAFSAASNADAASAAAYTADAVAPAPAAFYVARSAANAASAAAYYSDDATAVHAADAAGAAANAAAIWAEVSADARALARGDSLAGAPLWTLSRPDWSREYWERLKAALPKDENWRVWIDWYEDRLKGVAYGEAKEFIFATVPEAEWKKGQAAANKWIADRLGELEGTQAEAPEEIASPKVLDLPPPALPEPGPGPRIVVRDERLDLAPHREPLKPPLGKRPKILLDELRDAVRDFANSFDPTSNAHGQIRKILERYRAQIELDDPDIDLIFALGLRLENTMLAVEREIKNGWEPELENSQREALSSALRLHAVLIASDPDGADLLAAADRYPYRREDDELFKESAEPIAEWIGKTQDFATERLSELVEKLLGEINKGEHPNRVGLVTRNTMQRTLVELVKAASLGVGGAILGHTEFGQAFVVHGATFADKAIAFLLNNEKALRVLAMTASEGFGFLVPVIEWLKMKLKI